MNCNEFEARCLAYLDGELEADLAAQAEAHVESCATCRGVLESDRRLKASLARVFSRGTLPTGFADRAFAALDRRVPVRDKRASRVIGVGLITAAAACLILWIGYPAGAPTSDPLRLASERFPNELAKAIEKLHVGCTAMGDGHHCKVLPRNDLKIIRDRMTDELEFAVMAPDWTSRGLDFVGADYCRLLGARVAHLVYKTMPDDLSLSMISVGSMRDRFECCERKEHKGRPYHAVRTGDGSIVAWHADSDATYILCARLDPESLLKLAEPVRVALEGALAEPGHPGRDPAERFLLASMGWKSGLGRSINR